MEKKRDNVMDNFLPIQDMPRRVTFHFLRPPTVDEIPDLGTVPGYRPPSPADKVHSCNASVSGSNCTYPDKEMVLCVRLAEGWEPEI